MIFIDLDLTSNDFRVGSFGFALELTLRISSAVLNNNRKAFCQHKVILKVDSNQLIKPF